MAGQVYIAYALEPSLGEEAVEQRRKAPEAGPEMMPTVRFVDLMRSADLDRGEGSSCCLNECARS
ncbi:hypothetical protein N7462_000302 [Penicillium macrosclerotiorum]|uniref:uncharacterized protein n=1 Tax=Penicillium macrosclerotiorum TaxID=303699 RepID=UPI00254705BC|nr:uncharacterized protein N7462_000302 [Penicillium macrosclerotiorum]KAJ5698297.1 hypothetical protein N7462_000302 [Penicillium macrosclerotiorum]